MKNINNKIHIRELELQDSVEKRQEQLIKEVGKYCDVYSAERTVPVLGEIDYVYLGNLYVKTGSSDFLDRAVFKVGSLNQIFIHDKE